MNIWLIQRGLRCYSIRLHGLSGRSGFLLRRNDAVHDIPENRAVTPFATAS